MAIVPLPLRHEDQPTPPVPVLPLRYTGTKTSYPSRAGTGTKTNLPLPLRHEDLLPLPLRQGHEDQSPTWTGPPTPPAPARRPICRGPPLTWTGGNTTSYRSRSGTGTKTNLPQSASDVDGRKYDLLPLPLRHGHEDQSAAVRLRRGRAEIPPKYRVPRKTPRALSPTCRSKNASQISTSSS